MASTPPTQCDPRFSSLSEEAFTEFICEHMSVEANIPFEFLFYHEHIVEYSKESAKSGRVKFIESLDEYINIRLGSYKRLDELYVMITGLQVSKKTLDYRVTSAIAAHFSWCQDRCRFEYDELMKSRGIREPEVKEW